MKHNDAKVHVHFNVVQLTTPEGKSSVELVLDSPNSLRLSEFKKKLVPGQVVDVFYDANKDDGTLAQLAKIHASLKQIAIDTGNNVLDLKLEAKRRSGLCIKKRVGEDLYMVCKSLSRCSKEELALVINSVIEMGDFVNSNVR